MEKKEVGAWEKLLAGELKALSFMGSDISSHMVKGFLPPKNPEEYQKAYIVY